jgi:hypothetical protein
MRRLVVNSMRADSIRPQLSPLPTVATYVGDDLAWGRQSEGRSVRRLRVARSIDSADS